MKCHSESEGGVTRWNYSSAPLDIKILNRPAAMQSLEGKNKNATAHEIFLGTPISEENTHGQSGFIFLSFKKTVSKQYSHIQHSDFKQNSLHHICLFISPCNNEKPQTTQTTPTVRLRKKNTVVHISFKSWETASGVSLSSPQPRQLPEKDFHTNSF